MTTFFLPYKEYDTLYNPLNGNFSYTDTDKTEAVKEFVAELIKLGYPEVKIAYEEDGIGINVTDTVLNVVTNMFSCNTIYTLKYGNITLAYTHAKLTPWDSYKLVFLSPDYLKQLPTVLLADTEETKIVLSEVYNDYENGRLADFPAEDEEKQEKYLKTLFNKIWQEKGYTENHLAYKTDKSWQDFVKLRMVKKLEQYEVINQVYKTIEESHLQTILKNKNYDIKPLLEKAWQDKGHSGQELASKVDHSLPIISARLKDLISAITIKKVVRRNLRKEIYMNKLESLPEIKALRQSILELSPPVYRPIKTREDHAVLNSRNDAAKNAIVNLNKLLTRYLKKGNFSEASYNTFKELFNSELQSKDSYFSQYLSYEYKSMVLKNIALCLTVIGALAVVGKLIYSKITVGRATGFFDKTNESIQAEKIKEALEKVTPDIKVK